MPGAAAVSAVTTTEWLVSRTAFFWWAAAVALVLFYHLVWHNRIRVWPLRARYIPTESLVVLSQYQYKSGMSSWLDVNVMNPLWTWTANHCLPDWLAPNAITTLSLSHGVATCALLLWYAPALTGVAPYWVYLLGAYNMWMYQLLDALDGKQARRLDASSPLGQLFDHGCDALCCFMSAFMVSAVLQTGATWTTLVLFAVHIVPFFVSNWEEVQTGYMRFGVLGITEAQLLVMGLLAANGVFGPQIWQTRIGGLVGALQAVMPADWAQHLTSVKLLTADTPVYYGLVVFALCSVAFALYDTFTVVNHHNAQHKIDPTAGRWQLGQFLALLALGFAWCLLTLDTVYGAAPVLPLFAIGLCFAYLVGRLIVHKTAHAPFSRCHEILWPLPLVVLNAAWRKYLPALTVPLCGCGPLNDTAVAWAYFGFVLVVYAHFVTSAIREITAFLRIRVFHLPTPQQRAAKKAAREAAAAAAAASAAAAVTTLA